MTRPERPRLPKPPPTVVDEGAARGPGAAARFWRQAHNMVAMEPPMPWWITAAHWLAWALAWLGAALLVAVLASEARAQCDPLAERGCRLRLEAGAAAPWHGYLYSDAADQHVWAEMAEASQLIDDLTAGMGTARHDRDEALEAARQAQDVARQAGERIRDLLATQCPEVPEPVSRAAWALGGAAAGIAVGMVVVLVVR